MRHALPLAVLALFAGCASTPAPRPRPDFLPGPLGRPRLTPEPGRIVVDVRWMTSPRRPPDEPRAVTEPGELIEVIGAAIDASAGSLVFFHTVDARLGEPVRLETTAAEPDLSRSTPQEVVLLERSTTFEVVLGEDATTLRVRRVEGARIEERSFEVDLLAARLVALVLPGASPDETDLLLVGAR